MLVNGTMLEGSTGVQAVIDFLEETSGTSLYEFALVASLITVVSILVLVALDLAA